MSGPSAIRGVWCATLTPLDARGGVDEGRLAAHAQRLFAEGVDGIAPFGTTGEGQSFGLAERRSSLERIVAAGVAPERILAATGCAALPDAVELTRHAMQTGCAGALVLPPFFWKDPTVDGLYAYYAALIDGVGDARLRLYLYHIPQITGVPISATLLGRLRAAYPGIVAGAKDSAGDLDHTLALVRSLPDLAILTGHEPHLPAVLAAGGAGTVCGAANFFPRALRDIFDGAETARGEAALATVRAFVSIVFDYPLMPAYKALLASLTSNDAWSSVRPPLAPLPAADRAALVERLRRSGVVGAAAARVP